jgi:hypothetical protein
VRLLGAPLSSSAEYTSDFVRDKAREVLEVLQKLQLLRDPQVELLLLRSCMGICRLMQVLRCSPADCVEEGVALFDAGQRVALRRIVVVEGGGLGPLQEETAALPIAAGGLGITRGADLVPVAYVASSIQTMPLQEEILREMEPTVPVASAVSEAKATLIRLLPRGQEGILDDPEATSSGLQSRLSLLLSDCRGKAVLALPAQDRVVEVITSAAEGSVSSWLLALPVERLGQTMSPLEFRCRLRYQLCVKIFREGARCPRCSATMDAWGDHAVQGRVGRGVANKYRHNMVYPFLVVTWVRQVIYCNKCRRHVTLPLLMRKRAGNQGQISMNSKP